VIKTNIRQSPAVPGFFYWHRIVRLPRDNSAVMFNVVALFDPVDPRGAKLLHLKHCASARAVQETRLLSLLDGIFPGFDPDIPGGSYPQKQSRKTPRR
jgi:hypothetical protein